MAAGWRRLAWCFGALALVVALVSLPAGRRVALAAPPGCTGDVDGGGSVNSIDLQQVAVRFGPSSSGFYDAQYDLNHDGNINSLDLQSVALHFGPCQPIVVYLSDLPTTGTPSNGWGPFERDMSNGEQPAGDGVPLKIEGTTYAKGLGTNAPSDLRFAVPAGCTTFSSQVGIDDEVGAQGSVTFEVWDGTASRLYQSPVKTGADASTAVSVPITGVSTLRLVGAPGADTAFDHGDWANATLTCPNGDVTSPLVSGVQAAPGPTSATITWTTDEMANSRVEYGLTAGYGSSTALSSLLVTAHSVAASGLLPSTTYHYRVKSRDPAGNLTVGADNSFTTTASLFGPGASFGAGSHTHSVVIVDVNGDNKMDLVTANAGADNVSVLLGDGAGSFAPAVSYGTGSQPKSVTFGYLNADANLDLVTANQGTSNVSVLLGNGNGTFQPRTDIPACTNSHEATIADLNGDTKMDIACAGWGAPFVGVLLGNGNGTFAPVVSYPAGPAPHSIVAGYFNADTALDLAVADHDGTAISVLLGNGNGTLPAEVRLHRRHRPHSLRMSDLDGDGNLDLVNVNDGSDNVTVLMGNGDGTFNPAVSYPAGNTPKGVAIADIDGDGKLDVLAANINDNYPNLVNLGGDSISVLLGNGDGTFKPKTDYAVGQGPFAVAAGFINSDLKLDIVTADWWDNGVMVRLNTGP